MCIRDSQWAAQYRIALGVMEAGDGQPFTDGAPSLQIGCCVGDRRVINHISQIEAVAECVGHDESLLQRVGLTVRV